MKSTSVYKQPGKNLSAAKESQPTSQEASPAVTAPSQDQEPITSLPTKTGSTGVSASEAGVHTDE